MRVASVDIGTNTILLLVAEFDNAGVLRVLRDAHAIGRLGKGVDASRRIIPETFVRCEHILRSHLEICRELGVERICMTGTSALRDAINGHDFVDAMHRATGVRIETLTGEEEAQWSWLGSTSSMQCDDTPIAVLDIGGGSTELAIGRAGSVFSHGSVNIGAVRLTEKCFRAIPPTDNELREAETLAMRMIADLPPFDGRETGLVAVAGTVTTLAAIERGLTEFDPLAIAGHRITLDTLQRRYAQMCRMTREQIETSLHVNPGRADIIVAGMTILRAVMQARHVESFIVSERGLRYGIAMREFQRASAP